MVIRYTNENFEDHWGFADWKNKIVLDIGADFGSTAECFLANGSLRVYAVEGDHNLYNQMIEFCKNNPDKNIYPIEKQINNSEDFIYLLNNYKADIIKVDCENCEKHLPQVPDYILKSINEYAIECHSNSTLKDIENKFRSIGFRTSNITHLTTDISVIHITSIQNYSIVIPTYGTNGIKLTDNLIKSIYNFYNPNLDEIIISEDGSTLDSMSLLTELKNKYNKLNIKLIFNSLQQSFSKTVNNGIRNSNPNNDILLLNNDMIALTNFEPFINSASTRNLNNKIGIIGAKLLYPDGTIQHAGISRGKYTRNFNHIYKNEDSDIPEANILKQYIAVTGACLYIKKELINKIGLLDENYNMSFEDIDYCINAQLNGFEVWYNPEVKLVHYEMSTRSTDNDNSNYNTFWNKWEGLYQQLDPSLSKEENIKAVVTIGGIAGGAYLLTKLK